MGKPMKVLVVGVGGMGASHALGYSKLPGIRLGGSVVAKNVERAKKLAADLGLPNLPVYTDYYKAIAELKPDVVSVNTARTPTRRTAIRAMSQRLPRLHGEAHRANGRGGGGGGPQVAGRRSASWSSATSSASIPPWTKFIELARTLGKPLIMRMNLNQQSYGHEWEVHKSFIANAAPGGLRRALRGRDVPDDPREAVMVQGIAARVSEEIGERGRTTARCRWCSRTSPWAGTRWAGVP